MAQKPSIPKGTRDFTPLETARRDYIFNTIREVFALFGFSAIETPAMENLSTLMGKYGEEGDKLLFKILNSGDWTRPLADGEFDTRDDAGERLYTKMTNKVSEKGLRYDLTVPFARFVVQHRNEIQFPFKRYQIQPVWRADRPQKGRYREFFQCDADIVGSDSLVNEVELIQLIDEVFKRLKINVTIKVNNRKILAGIAELIGAPDKIIDITVAIDKLDKIGIDAVNEELTSRGLTTESVERLQPILAIDGDTAQRIDTLAKLLAENETGTLGVNELKYVLGMSEKLGLNAQIELDASLARGLNYYTGTIIEVKARDVAIGSITGGGRYDNLTGVFGMPGVSGVGISFGADRIYDVLNALDLYPDNAKPSVTVMFANLGDAEALASMRILKVLRAAGIPAEIYPDNAKMKKQMNFADATSARFVAFIGESELADNKVTIKNMASGNQATVEIDNIIDAIASLN